jgi:hypothetical protein
MERDVLAFCRRQSAKMIEYAEDCADPKLKEQFLQMSDYWQSLIPAPSPQAGVTMPPPTSASAPSLQSV